MYRVPMKLGPMFFPRQAIRVGIVFLLYGKSYNITMMLVACSDQGHDGVTRFRVYFIMSHKETVVAVVDVQVMYDKVTQCISRHCKTQPKDYLIAPPEEILLDAADVARARGKRWRRAT